MSLLVMKVKVTEGQGHEQDLIMCLKFYEIYKSQTGSETNTKFKNRLPTFCGEEQVE